MNQQSFESWKEAKRQAILNRYSHLNLDFETLYNDHMTFLEKREFMTEEQIYLETRKTEKEYLGKNLDFDVHIEQKALEFVDKVTSNKTKVSEERLKEIKEHTKEYSKKISKELNPDRRFNRKEKREKNLLICSDELVKFFYNKYLKNRFRKKAFVIDDENKIVLRKLLMYFIRDERVESAEMFDNPLDLSKSIFLFGPVGTGKSSIMTAFSEFTHDMNFCNKFEVSNFTETNTFCSGPKGNSYIHTFKGRDWCHDELIPKTVKSMGNSISPTEYLIQQSYNRFEKSGNPTHYTSNADPNVLNNIVDLRTFTRLKSMSNFVYLGGNSRRK